VRTQCPHCHAKFKAPDEVTGKKVKCQKCNKPFVIFPVVQNNTVETCTNCRKSIGKTEQVFVFNGNILCKACDEKLRGSADTVLIGKDKTPQDTPSKSPTPKKIMKWLLCDSFHKNTIVIMSVVCIIAASFLLYMFVFNTDRQGGQATESGDDVSVRTITEVPDKGISDTNLVSDALLTCPPIKLVEGESLGREGITLIGHSNPKKSLLVGKDTVYCSRVLITPKGETEWKYEIWPLKGGELSLRRKDIESKDTKQDPQDLAFERIEIPKMEIQWIAQPHEIRTRDDSRVYRCSRGEEYAVLQDKDLPPLWLDVRLLKYDDVSDVLETYLALPPLTLGAGAKMSIFPLAEKGGLSSPAIIVTFENRTTREELLTLPPPKKILARLLPGERLIPSIAMFVGQLGKYLEEPHIITEIEGNLSTKIPPKSYVEILYFFSEKIENATISIDKMGDFRPGVWERHW
jgi:predicted Zn finger-like uncharacterized protein